MTKGIDLELTLEQQLFLANINNELKNYSRQQLEEMIKNLYSQQCAYKNCWKEAIKRTT